MTITSASKAFNLAGLRWAILHAGSAELQRALDALPWHYFGAPNLMARRGDGGGVDRRRRVAAGRRRPARRQPAPPRRRCCRRTCPTSATACPTRRTSPGSTAVRSASATTPPRRSASGGSSSARAALRAAGHRVRPPQLRHEPACSTRIVEAMAGITRLRRSRAPRLAPSASGRWSPLQKLARVVPVRRAAWGRAGPCGRT